MGFGLIATESGFQGLAAQFTRQTINSMMTAAAASSGRPELEMAPLAYIGFSGGGWDSMVSAQHAPERAIAYVANRIAIGPHEDAQPGWTEVPGLFLAGGRDDNQQPSEVFEAVIKGSGFLSGTAIREQGGLAALGVVPNGSHSDESGFVPAGAGYEMAMYWISQASKHRLPANPPAPFLNDFESDEGWLGAADQYVLGSGGSVDTPGGVSAFKPIGPIGSYPGDPTTASWLIDADTAQAYRAFASNDLAGRTRLPLGTPLVISSIAPLASFTRNATVSIVVNPRDYDDTVPISRMEFYDGAQLLGSDNTSADGWSFNALLATTGVRALNVIGYRSDGQIRAGLRVVSVVAVVPEPQTLLIAASMVSLIFTRRCSRARQ